MKLKFIAAAAVLAVSGAHAAIDNGQTGNGSLVANLAYGNNSAGSSAAFDLGLSFSDVATWQSSINATLAGGATEWYRSWNLATGELSGTGLSTTVVGNYGSVLADFNAAAAAAGATATSQLSLFAFDGTGVSPGERSIYTTGSSINNTTGGSSTLLAPINSVFNGLQASTTVTNFLAEINRNGTHSSDNGASLLSAGSLGYFYNGGGMEKLANTAMFDTSGQFNGSFNAGTTTFAGNVKSVAFYNLVASSITSTAKSTVSAIGYDIDGDGVIEFDNNAAVGNGLGVPANGTELGLWTLQGNDLRFSVAAAVPEPESYAMLLAGLGLMGAVARRRRNAR